MKQVITYKVFVLVNNSWRLIESHSNLESAQLQLRKRKATPNTTGIIIQDYVNSKARS
jgi:hypothetical protein